METIIVKPSAFFQNLMKTAEPVVVLPLKKWKNIEDDLEDLEMYRSAGFANEIAKRRKETKTIPLNHLLKKYKI